MGLQTILIKQDEKTDFLQTDHFSFPFFTLTRLFGSGKYTMGAFHEIMRNRCLSYSVKIDGKEVYAKQEWKYMRKQLHV
jgi:hypothetical protein